MGRLVLLSEDAIERRLRLTEQTFGEQNGEQTEQN
jgi:hypothetical protein